MSRRSLAIRTLRTPFPQGRRPRSATVATRGVWGGMAGFDCLKGREGKGREGDEMHHPTRATFRNPADPRGIGFAADSF